MGWSKTQPETRECVICTETKRVYRNFPQLCNDHAAETCLQCLTQHTVTRLEEARTWEACTCPQCNNVLPTGDIQAALPRPTVRELTNLIKRAESSSEEAWRWCLASGCDHGSLQKAGKDGMIKCRKCKAKACFQHQVPWHDGKFVTAMCRITF